MFCDFYNTDPTKPSNTTTADQLEADRLLAMRLANEEDDFLVHDWTTPPESLSLPTEPASRDRESELQDLGLENEDLEFLLNEAKYGCSPPPRQISPPRQRGSSFSRSRQFSSNEGVDEAGNKILLLSGIQVGFYCIPIKHIPSNIQGS